MPAGAGAGGGETGLRLLFIGDVVGQAGCNLVQARLPAYRRQEAIDFVVANGENSAEGNGILPSSAEQLFAAGVDVITTGNHGLRRREIFRYMEENPYLLRPANYHSEAPGRGYCLYDGLRWRFLVINLQGVAFMDPQRNPFETVDALLASADAPNILVDFHAEATAEKAALAYYLDGRVTAVLGTHTHVPTADERVLPGGTGFITDAGMCGGSHSVLGVKAELAVRRMRTGLPTRFENDPSDCILCGVQLEVDERIGKTTKIDRVLLK